MEHTWHAPKQGEIYKFQCSNNTPFMGTSKFTYGAHKACPQKGKIYKFQSSNNLHNLWGLPNLPIGPS